MAQSNIHDAIANPFSVSWTAIVGCHRGSIMESELE